jgi:hypothetical protein
MLHHAVCHQPWRLLSITAGSSSYVRTSPWVSKAGTVGCSCETQAKPNSIWHPNSSFHMLPYHGSRMFQGGWSEPLSWNVLEHRIDQNSLELRRWHRWLLIRSGTMSRLRSPVPLRSVCKKNETPLFVSKFRRSKHGHIQWHQVARHAALATFLPSWLWTHHMWPGCDRCEYVQLQDSLPSLLASQK